MKILLLEPPFYRLYSENFSLDKYPLSLGYLASIIKENTSFEINVFNADFSENSIPRENTFVIGEGFENYKRNLKDGNYVAWQDVRQTILRYNPDVIGVSAKSQNYRSACIVAEIAKSCNKRIVVVIGGPHPTLIREKTLENSNIDYAVIGEGEVTFLQLLTTISNNGSMKDVDGLIYRNGINICINKPRSLLKNLDELASPYKHVKEVLIDFEKYPLNSFRSLFATRGCPFGCTFCGSKAIWTRKVRFRSVENVIDEIKLLRRINVNYFNFDDDTFGVTKKYLIELCDGLRSECKGILWSCEIHVKLVSDEVLKIMKSAGCDLIRLGIESGNNEILKKIRKNITIEEAFEATDKITNNRINLTSFFMVGFPHETEETLQDTYNAIKKIKGTVTYSIFTPYLGTEAFNQCLELNTIPDDFDVSMYNHQSPENNFSSYIEFNTFRKKAEEIELFIDKKNKKYYDRRKIMRFMPANLLRKLARKL